MNSYLMQLWTLVDNGLEEFHTVLAAERRESADHFMYETGKTPPIYISPVSDLLDDLRRKVLRCPANGGGAFFVLQYLGEPKICEFDVSALINDHIFRLEAECCDAYSRYMTLCLCNAYKASTICAA